jgi:hypothetical protein
VEGVVIAEAVAFEAHGEGVIADFVEGVCEGQNGLAFRGEETRAVRRRAPSASRCTGMSCQGRLPWFLMRTRNPMGCVSAATSAERSALAMLRFSARSLPMR